ncbi:MAG TPA: redoxin family protein [Puia sp.]|nr:redoxin family protein [Puia sp.]
MRERSFFFSLMLLTSVFFAVRLHAQEYQTLSIDSLAPDFSLPGIDGRLYSLSSFRDAKVLVLIFTCNHCPTAQSYEERIMQLTDDYRNKGVQVVAVNPNDPRSLRPDELDFSDIGDSFDEMKIRARERHFNFPYLYDGDSEKMSKAYGPIATPHVFIFDESRRLRYQGRFDDEDRHGRTPHQLDARNAVDALLDNRPVAVPITKVFGCSIKWSDKRNWIVKSRLAWSKESVILDTISLTGGRNLLRNYSQKLRLVSFWSTASQISSEQFPELITINRMYRDRDFELVTVSFNTQTQKAEVLHFLKKEQASSRNYIFSGDAISFLRLAGASGQDGLPMTLLIEPGGKVVFRKKGAIDPSKLKKEIIDNRMIGRYY